MPEQTAGTSTASADPAPPADTATSDQHSEASALTEADLLVEDVSIDGMCGVY